MHKEVSTGPASEADSAWGGVAREPTPEEAAVLAETVEQILQGLNEKERQNFQLCLEGHSAPEISAQVSPSEHTVHWIVKRIRKRLRQVRDEIDEPVDGSS